MESFQKKKKKIGIFSFFIDPITRALSSPGILSLFSVSGLHIEFNKSLRKWSFSYCLDFMLSVAQPDYENDL